MKIFVIVPVFNEGIRAVDTIKDILKQTKSGVIVIDDGSSDRSYQMLKKQFGSKKQVVLCKHIVNLGKGAVMKTGVEMALKLKADGVVFMDADGQHNPKHLPKFEKMLNKSLIVFGYRRLSKGMPIVRRTGNVLASFLVKNLFGIKKRDLLSGYLGFNLRIYPKIKWSSSRYGVETEMATKIGRNKIMFKEILIDTIYIDKYKGVSILDGLKILEQIPFWYFSK